jgi:hypothetical protein
MITEAMKELDDFGAERAAREDSVTIDPHSGTRGGYRLDGLKRGEGVSVGRSFMACIS